MKRIPRRIRLLAALTIDLIASCVDRGYFAVLGRFLFKLLDGVPESFVIGANNNTLG